MFVTKVSIYFYVHTVEVNGSQNILVINILQNIAFIFGVLSLLVMILGKQPLLCES